MKQDAETLRLLEGARVGNADAIAQLMGMHRKKLKRMVRVRLDTRLASRVDASDVVQESLMRASQNLTTYLDEESVSFYLWLRRITLNHLVDLRRRHVKADRRSVLRESPNQVDLPDASAMLLCGQLVSPDSSPSERVQREEQRQQIRAAIQGLSDTDRDILVMRILEQMSTAEVAESLGCSPGAVRQRQYRAIQSLRAALSE